MVLCPSKKLIFDRGQGYKDVPGKREIGEETQFKGRRVSF